MLTEETVVLVQKWASRDSGVFALTGFWKLELLGACIVLGTVVFFHLLSFFMCIWSLRYRIHVRYERVCFGRVSEDRCHRLTEQPACM